jgi:hypothetical protein
MKQQTAVEWLASNLEIIWEEKIIDIVERAKAMEQQQIETAFFDGDIFGADYYDPENPNADVSTNYYNQKYKSNESKTNL